MKPFEKQTAKGKEYLGEINKVDNKKYISIMIVTQAGNNIEDWVTF